MADFRGILQQPGGWPHAIVVWGVKGGPTATSFSLKHHGCLPFASWQMEPGGKRHIPQPRVRHFTDTHTRPIDPPQPQLYAASMEDISGPSDIGEIPSARGGRRRPEIELLCEIVRGLTEEDLPKLESPDSLGTTPIPIQQLRATHHQLAQLLAKGMPDNEAALITGYSPSRISILKTDPAFSELLASYRELREGVFVDTLERMRILGLSTLDELQERLENDSKSWSHRELMEMADLLLVKPRIATPMGQGSAAGGTGAPPVTVQVQFVQSSTPALVIEGKAEKIGNS